MVFLLLVFQLHASYKSIRRFARNKGRGFYNGLPMKVGYFLTYSPTHAIAAGGN